MPSIKNLATVAIIAAVFGSACVSAQVVPTDAEITLPNITDAPPSLSSAANATEGNWSSETTMPVITDPVGSTILDNETIVSNENETDAPSEEPPVPNGVPSALASAGVAVASTVAVALGLLAL